MQPQDINQEYDRQTVALMNRVLRKDSSGVDVGCHTGDLLKEILRAAPDGTHWAFEPLPGLCQRLLELYPHVNVHNVALSDRAEETSFQHVIDSPGYSGLRRRDYDRPDRVVEEIKVRSELLDNIIPENCPIHFLKVDVEGAELQVFRGAIRTIRRNKPVIVFEHGLGAANHYGTRPEDVYDLLTGQCGMRVSLMEDWLKGLGPLERAEFVDQFHRGKNFYFMAHG